MEKMSNNNLNHKTEDSSHNLGTPILGNGLPEELDIERKKGTV
jgi:hypothetical protein